MRPQPLAAVPLWRRAVVTAVALLPVSPVVGEPVPGSRGLVLEGIDNERAPFAVRVDVDRSDATYAIGDRIKVTVRSERDGHLYLLYVDAEENVACIFPNRVQQSNAIEAGKDVVVPAEGSGFNLRVAEPIGTETLKALVTAEPLESMQHERLIAGDKTVLTARDLQVVKGESEARVDWAEDDVSITTLARREDPRPARRHALVVGVADHVDGMVPPRPASREDARVLAAALRDACKFDTTEVLIDGEATREKIRQVLTVSLRNATAAGDTVLLAWSGRIARLTDDDNDEVGGCDTVLLPHDARCTDAAELRSSGISDDELCDWVRELDGRTIVILIDGCDDTKLPASAVGSAEAEEGGPLDREVARLSELGQRRLAVVAAVRPGETPLTKAEAAASEMTVQLAERVRAGAGPLTIAAAFAAVSPVLGKLAQERQAPASPSLVGDAADAELVPATAPPARDQEVVPPDGDSEPDSGAAP